MHIIEQKDLESNIFHTIRIGIKNLRRRRKKNQNFAKNIKSNNKISKRFDIPVTGKIIQHF